MATTSPSPRPPARPLTDTPGRAARPAAIGIGLLTNLVYAVVLTTSAGTT
ncbi:hypothetical protein [Streptomyces virginiae]|nr:hypothetical protein [Streptomyces virginiae]MCX4960238.1 hypothetical protein [Streptomyces virginiae]